MALCSQPPVARARQGSGPEAGSASAFSLHVPGLNLPAQTSSQEISALQECTRVGTFPGPTSHGSEPMKRSQKGA